LIARDRAVPDTNLDKAPCSSRSNAAFWLKVPATLHIAATGISHPWRDLDRLMQEWVQFPQLKDEAFWFDFGKRFSRRAVHFRFTCRVQV